MDDTFSSIGTQEIWGGEKAVGPSLSDRRQHLYHIGKTGSGKTTLLRNLIVQHLAAGHGIGFIAPHSDLAEELLDCVPPHRADDLVYSHPGDLELPAPRAALRAAYRQAISLRSIPHRPQSPRQRRARRPAPCRQRDRRRIQKKLA